MKERREGEKAEPEKQPQEEEEEGEWMPDPNFSLANINQKMKENDMRFDYDSASKNQQSERSEPREQFIDLVGSRQDVFQTPPQRKEQYEEERAEPVDNMRPGMAGFAEVRNALFQERDPFQGNSRLLELLQDPAMLFGGEDEEEEAAAE